MKADNPTLPTGPLPHPAMDYARLRTEGLRLVGRLAGEQWTDFNTHDPGITILEQLCYAITDLGYRCNHPMADLLAPAPDPGLPGPAAILSGDPVTSADLRKLVLDIAGTDNARVGPPYRSELDFYYHAGSEQLRLKPDAGEIAAQPVALRGLLQVAVQTRDGFSGGSALHRIRRRLHAGRLLGQDFEVDWLEGVEVRVRASIEVVAGDDPTSVLADILEGIEDRLAPPARFVPPTEARASGQRLDQIFEGPQLARGVVERLPKPPRSIFASDLIHAITDVPQVRAVRSVSPKSVTIPEDKVARLGRDSAIILLRDGLPIQADLGEARKRVEQRRTARRPEPASMGSFEPPGGRNRSLRRYTSIRRQLPAAYGIGPLGLPVSASPRRRVQAQQLAAYLLIFDQLLANQLAQLAHAHELLSPGDGETRTYFAQPVEDPPLALQELLGASAETATPEALRLWLDRRVGDDEPGRRKRFLAHLLARFAEQLGDDSQVQHGGRGEASPDAATVARRRTFLRRYPRLSGARGSGYDLYEGTVSGLVERLRLKLGMPELRFDLVEHILLRPVPEDRNQLDPDGEAPVPLLAGVARSDPWSLTISLVLKMPDPAGRGESWFDELQRLVARTVLAEAPAHLRVHLHWLDAEGDTTWAAFEAAWADFKAKLRVYRQPQLGQPPGGPIPDPRLAPLRLRDARDRLIDLLGIGLSFPLRDLPWSRHAIVPPGTATKVELGFSQRGVDYELWDSDDNRVLLDGKPIGAEGSGGALVLSTPPIEADVTYRVLATKRELLGSAPEELDLPPEPRQAWLHGEMLIEEGVDPTLPIEILDLDLLDPRIDNPKPTDARIADYGVEVRVAVHESQEGVLYELRDWADRGHGLSTPVVGTSGTIVLRLDMASEDMDLCIHGSKDVGDANAPDLRSASLHLVLPLRVRADPAVAAELAPVIVAHGRSAGARLSGTQANVSYQVWQRPMRDDEHLFEPQPTVPTIDIPGDNRLVRIAQPPTSLFWQDLPGFSPLGPASRGTGGLLEIKLGPAKRDLILLFQASKHHRSESAAIPKAVLIPSAVQLAQALALLVRPDDERLLRLQARVVGGVSEGPWLIRDGQPGVFYELRLQDEAIAQPAYFHQRNDHDGALNKGVGRLRVEVDLAIPRDPKGPVDRPRTPPPSPLLEARPVPEGSELEVLARKAMSGLVTPLGRKVILDPVPVVRAEPARVAAGEAAKVVVESALAGERYTLLRGEEVVDGPREGTGEALALDTGPLAATGLVTVAIERLGDNRLPLERRVALTIEVG